MIDTSMKMRAISKQEPLWEEFLQSKGLPFTAKNPITNVVTFDRVCKLMNFDKNAFLAEFDAYKAERGA